MILKKSIIMDIDQAVLNTRKFFLDQFGSNDSLFTDRIFKDGLDKYVDRLKSIDFKGLNNVLDIGCGFGQWSISLSKLNKHVYSSDISSLRVNFLDFLSDQLGINNIKTNIGETNHLPYEDKKFDAIFCYGVIFLTPWKETLSELSRVLKPNGKLYINYNRVGWYLFLWETEHNKTSDYDPRLLASKAFNDTLIYERKGEYESGMNLIMEPDDVKNELKKLNFNYIISDHEGCIKINEKQSDPEPFFKKNYKSNPCIFETYGIKACEDY